MSSSIRDDFNCIMADESVDSLTIRHRPQDVDK